MNEFSRRISPERRRRLVLMVTAPEVGRVKVRLGREIGMVPACWWFRHQLRRLMRRLQDPRWQLILAVAPARSRGWPPSLPRLPQGGGPQGARLLRLFATLPPGPVLIVSADVPDLTPARVMRAFALLDRAELVLGPARDGGYWAIGANRIRRLRRGLLDGIRWSTGFAMADTLIALRDRRIAFADTLRDVDVAADLRRGTPRKRVARGRKA